ncbi:MAG: hypothetical protein JW959_09980 [Pirellulales bacterium]|nr:hypothetical protein [Pirellulales bacterium]
MELYYSPRISLGAALFAFVAAAFLAAGAVYHNPHPAIFALAPAMLALGLWLSRTSNFAGRLTEEGLEVDRPKADKILYPEIEGLTINGLSVEPDSQKLKRGRVMVMHRRGVLEIPAGVNLPIQKVYKAIYKLLPTTGSYQLSALFAEHVEKETAKFGVERVHSFCTRKHYAPRRSTRRERICAAMLFLCGAAWCFVPAVWSDPAKAAEAENWPGAGITFMVLSVIGIGWLFALQHSTMPVVRKNYRDSELIVSPTGIAVKQGDLNGQLRWGELVNVAYTSRQPFYTVNPVERTGHIHLKIAGTAIHVPDIYDRPLALIHQLIMRYWKGK